MIISAYFFVGSIKSSKAGFTNFEYCTKVEIFHNTNDQYINKQLVKQSSTYLMSHSMINVAKPFKNEKGPYINAE